MTKPQDSFLINLKQAECATDKKARIHRIIHPQPAKCQIEKIDDFKVASTESEAVKICQAEGVDYKFCEYCF